MMHSSVLLFLSNLFSSDGILIIIVALLIFGGDKLPEIARGLGKGIRDFKDASEDVKREINNQIYSFEEKKQEEKRIEEAAKADQDAAQNPTNTETAANIRPPVENTVPINENIFTGESAGKIEAHNDNHNGLSPENHAEVPHTNSGAQTV